MYLFFLCGVDKSQILSVIENILDFNFSKNVKTENNFSLIKHLRIIYNFEKITGIETKVPKDLILEEGFRLLKEKSDKLFSLEKIDAMEFLVKLFLYENVKVEKNTINEIKKIIEIYLKKYRSQKDDYNPFFLLGKSFWNYFSLLCLFFLIKSKDDKLSKDIEKFCEDFLDEEIIKFIIFKINKSIYKKELMELLINILCKINKEQVFKQKIWFLGLICERED
jgi:hypothetical protein